MHKKKASLVPLTFEFDEKSEQEVISDIHSDSSATSSRPPSTNALSRPSRWSSSRSAEASVCMCAVSATTPTPQKSLRTRTYTGASSPIWDETEVAVTVNGHNAVASLSEAGLRWSYDISNCCVPGTRTESVPFTEILSAQVLPPVSMKMWHPYAVAAHRLAFYTFQRSIDDPAQWFPRQLTLCTPKDSILHKWAGVINASVAAQPKRPHSLLVVINPFGGFRRGVTMYKSVVAPVFDKAGIKCTVFQTKYGGHASETLLQMSGDELSSYDGIVAVGGDGIFHEIINSLISLRIKGVNAALRVGHIPAGSTDAVACTLNGTRSAFTAAMHIALGDSTPLDVLRMDSSETGHHHLEFATCMASYGFMGDLMMESENVRWLGPLRYDVVGAKMLAANRSYRVCIEYLPAEPVGAALGSKACHVGCELCGQGSGPPDVMQRGAIREHSRRSLMTRSSDWVRVEDDFAGIMLVIMPCRSPKSSKGVAKYGHLSDGAIHLVMVRRCSRLTYFRFLLKMSRVGLEEGRHLGGLVEVRRAVAVKVQPQGKESRWNVDGELLGGEVAVNSFTAEVHRGAIDVFARGVEK